jgi:hypothetical protein
VIAVVAHGLEDFAQSLVVTNVVADEVGDAHLLLNLVCTCKSFNTLLISPANALPTLAGSTTSADARGSR